MAHDRVCNAVSTRRSKKCLMHRAHGPQGSPLQNASLVIWTNQRRDLWPWKGSHWLAWRLRSWPSSVTTAWVSPVWFFDARHIHRFLGAVTHSTRVLSDMIIKNFMKMFNTHFGWTENRTAIYVDGIICILCSMSEVFTATNSENITVIPPLHALSSSV